MTRSAHPQPDTLLVYGLGLLGNPEGNDASGEAQEIARHLSDCVSCRMTWDELRAFYADLSARLATLPADAFTEPPELSLDGDPESDVPGVGERGLVGALAQIRQEQNGAAPAPRRTVPMQRPPRPPSAASPPPAPSPGLAVVAPPPSSDEGPGSSAADADDPVPSAPVALAPRRPRRLTWLRAAAAAVVVAVAVVATGVVAGYQGGRPSEAPPVAAPAPGERVITGTTGAVSATYRITPAAGWVKVASQITGLPPGEDCAVVVVAQDGTEKIAATWVTGSAPAGASVAGAASIDLGRIARVEVRNTAGQVFSTVPVV